VIFPPWENYLTSSVLVLGTTPASDLTDLTDLYTDSPDASRVKGFEMTFPAVHTFPQAVVHTRRRSG